MNFLLTMMATAGFLSVSVAYLKILETGNAPGVPCCWTERAILLSIVFLGIYATSEMLAATTQRAAGAAIFNFVVGVLALKRAFHWNNHAHAGCHHLNWHALRK